MNAQITPIEPNRTNVFRHESKDMTPMTSSGVKAPPQRALSQRMACERVRSRRGNQIMKTLGRFWKQPASPMAKQKRAMTRGTKVQKYPVAAVKTHHMI